MNTKKMTTEQLQEIIQEMNTRYPVAITDNADQALYLACSSELKRRWGIKG